MAQFSILNSSHPLNEPLQVEKCDTFLARLRGFMFRKGIERDSGLLFYQAKPSRLDSAIHMFFVSFDLGIIWLDDHFTVIEKITARSGHPFYAPHAPASYILEIHPQRISEFFIGDILAVEKG